MHKKIMLAASAFLFAAVAFYVFSSGDRSTRRESDGKGREAVRQFVSVPTTQGASAFGEAQMPISPGDQSRVVVYDESTGRPKYQFEAKGWKPISDTDYHVDELLITLYMPRGETSYISSDEADVTLTQKAKSRVDAQRGILRGHVRVIIDRTTTQWRQEHPDLSEMAAHPDDLIRIDLDSARFDMDRAELISEGPVVVDSREARIEDVSNLTVHWNQVDNRVEVLQFAEGGRMTIRRGANMIEFGLPGATRKKKKEGDGGIRVNAAGSVTGVDAAADGRVPLARANEAMSIESATAEEAAAEIRLEGARFMANTPQSIYGEGDSGDGAADESETPNELRTPAGLVADMEVVRNETRSAVSAGGDVPPEEDRAARKNKKSGDPSGKKSASGRTKRIHTYRAVFSNHVVVEQLKDAAPVGRLEADKLEVHFDFGGRQRQIATAGAGGSARPAGISANRTTEDGATNSDSNGDTTSGDSAAASRMDGTKPVLSTAQRSDLEALRADSDEADDSEMIVLTWHGPLELRPLFVPPGEQSGKRFDVIAVGDPVRIRSDRGNAVCNQLVYRGERKQIWLMGNEARPVEMSVDENRRLSGVEVFFDRRRGLGRVDGAGRMVDARGEIPGEDTGPESLARTASLKTNSSSNMGLLGKPRDPVEIHWTRGVDLEIGLRPVLRTVAEKGSTELKEKDYLRRAWFHGDVRFLRGEETLEADEVAATFGTPPMDEEDASDFIEHLNMTGEVRLERGGDRIEAERLDVEMVRATDGRNVPRKVDAVGRVLAKQKEREIRADVMHVVLGSYPGPARLAPDGRTQIAGKARLGLETMHATGDVQAIDPQHNMKIRRAETMDMSIRNGDELVKTLIVSKSPDVFARARFEDMAIHGHRIEIDADRQSVDVPGPGRAWMVTYEDFGGRRLDRPTPVKTTWTDQMQLRLAKDYGVFVGQVRSTTDQFALNCDKLTVRLGKAPAKVKKSKAPGLLERIGVLGDVGENRADIEFKDDITIRMEQKRPVYVVADGNAEAISSTYAASRSPTRGRLVSRARVAGRQIVADLRNEQMSVPCEGTLLIEDYQFEDTAGKQQKRRSSQVSSPLMSSVRDEGPSQTLVEWENSMDFFVDRALVAFDKNVRMLHLSGQQVVMRDELAEAFQLDPAALGKVSEGRRAELTCGNLLLEFATGKSAAPENQGAGQLVRATDLERLIARDAVHMQDGPKSLLGEYLQYLQATNEVRLEGGPGLDARIIDQAEGGRFNMWRGPLLIWNRANNAIQSPKSTITTSGR